MPRQREAADGQMPPWTTEQILCLVGEVVDWESFGVPWTDLARNAESEAKELAKSRDLPAEDLCRLRPKDCESFWRAVKAANGLELAKNIATLYRSRAKSTGYSPLVMQLKNLIVNKCDDKEAEAQLTVAPVPAETSDMLAPPTLLDLLTWDAHWRILTERIHDASQWIETLSATSQAPDSKYGHRWHVEEFCELVFAFCKAIRSQDRQGVWQSVTSLMRSQRKTRAYYDKLQEMQKTGLFMAIIHIIKAYTNPAAWVHGVKILLDQRPDLFPRRSRPIRNRSFSTRQIAANKAAIEVDQKSDLNKLIAYDPVRDHPLSAEETKALFDELISTRWEDAPLPKLTTCTDTVSGASDFVATMNALFSSQGVDQVEDESESSATDSFANESVGDVSAAPEAIKQNARSEETSTNESLDTTRDCLDLLDSSSSNKKTVTDNGVFVSVLESQLVLESQPIEDFCHDVAKAAKHDITSDSQTTNLEKHTFDAGKPAALNLSVLNVSLSEPSTERDGNSLPIVLELGNSTENSQTESVPVMGISSSKSRSRHNDNFPVADMPSPQPSAQQTDESRPSVVEVHTDSSEKPSTVDVPVISDLSAKTETERMDCTNSSAVIPTSSSNTKAVRLVRIHEPTSSCIDPNSSHRTAVVSQPVNSDDSDQSNSSDGSTSEEDLAHSAPKARYRATGKNLALVMEVAERERIRRAKEPIIVTSPTLEAQTLPERWTFDETQKLVHLCIKATADSRDDDILDWVAIAQRLNDGHRSDACDRRWAAITLSGELQEYKAAIALEDRRKKEMASKQSPRMISNEEHTKTTSDANDVRQWTFAEISSLATFYEQCNGDYDLADLASLATKLDRTISSIDHVLKKLITSGGAFAMEIYQAEQMASGKTSDHEDDDLNSNLPHSKVERSAKSKSAALSIASGVRQKPGRIGDHKKRSACSLNDDDIPQKATTTPASDHIDKKRKLQPSAAINTTSPAKIGAILPEARHGSVGPNLDTGHDQPSQPIMATPLRTSRSTPITLPDLGSPAPAFTSTPKVGFLPPATPIYNHHAAMASMAPWQMMQMNPWAFGHMMGSPMSMPMPWTPFQPLPYLPNPSFGMPAAQVSGGTPATTPASDEQQQQQQQHAADLKPIRKLVESLTATGYRPDKEAAMARLRDYIGLRATVRQAECVGREGIKTYLEGRYVAAERARHKSAGRWESLWHRFSVASEDLSLE